MCHRRRICSQLPPTPESRQLISSESRGFLLVLTFFLVSPRFLFPALPYAMPSVYHDATRVFVSPSLQCREPPQSRKRRNQQDRTGRLENQRSAARPLRRYGRWCSKEPVLACFGRPCKQSNSLDRCQRSRGQLSQQHNGKLWSCSW